VVSSGNLPEVNALIELAIFGGEAYPSRVEGREGDRLVVAAPLNLLISDLPEVGRMLTVRWPAGVRGRHAAPAKITEVHHDRVATWEVQVTGPPVIEQNRRYVRGGGGEPMRLQRMLSPDDPVVDARVVDISERSARGRFKDLKIRAGDPVSARIVLDDDVIDVTGTVLRVIEQPEPKVVDVVIVYDPDEAQATAIRRYVLRQQTLARARGAFE
jgi:hypothetical protein